MRTRLDKMLASASAALNNKFEVIDGSTYTEETDSPHPLLTKDSVVIKPVYDAEAAVCDLYDWLNLYAPLFGFLLAGSYIAAVIVEEA